MGAGNFLAKKVARPHFYSYNEPGDDRCTILSLPMSKAGFMTGETFQQQGVPATGWWKSCPKT
jgi:hypothetical protein